MNGQDKITAGLNPPQLEAVTHVSGPLLVLAGAGSGKTRVLTSRVAYLLATGNATPEEILAVTFTNKAAGEMKERIARLTEVDERRMQISTFHSFAARLLRFYGEQIGLKPNFTIYDEEDALSLIKNCITEVGFDTKTVVPRVMRALISDAKAELVGVTEYHKLASNFIAERAARIYERYQNRLEAAGAVDFDDLLFLSVKLLRDDAEVRSRLQNRYKFLLIDEYQDTNRAQYMMAKLLSEARHNILAVGDEDQSIYGWRGANINNILNFEKDFPNCKVIRLEQNYRSTQAILKAASAVVANNTRRKGKTLFSVGDHGEPVKLLITENDRDEAERITDQIEKQVSEGCPRSEVAILYRTNAQSRVLEESLKRRFIPYRIVGGVRFYQRKEIKDLLAYIRLITNPTDDVSFRRIINYPRRGIGDKSVQKLEAVAQEEECSLFELITNAHRLQQLSAAVTKKLQRFAEMIQYFTVQSQSMPIEPFMNLVAEKSGIVADLKEQDPSGTEGRLENIEELAASAGEYVGENPEATITDFLGEISLYTDLDNWDPDTDAVTLMTLHAAKGLEFQSVFIAGLEEGLFPLSRTIDDPEQLEEERRLFYVGMTRAKRQLAVSYALSRSRFGERLSMRSRFVDEIPDEVVEAQRFTLMQPGGRVSSDYMAAPANGNSDPYSAIRVGSIVNHPRWGEGAVLKRSGSGEHTEFEVRFTYAGTKTLLAKFAKLQLVRR